MSKTNTAQLTLLDLPAPARSAASPRSRRELPPEATTQHVGRLLAELDRAVAAHHARARHAPAHGGAARLSPAQEARMQHLARLFEAIETVHGSANADGDSQQAGPQQADAQHTASR